MAHPLAVPTPGPTSVGLRLPPVRIVELGGGPKQAHGKRPDGRRASKGSPSVTSVPLAEMDCPGPT